MVSKEATRGRSQGSSRKEKEDRDSWAGRPEFTSATDVMIAGSRQVAGLCTYCLVLDEGAGRPREKEKTKFFSRFFRVASSRVAECFPHRCTVGWVAGSVYWHGPFRAGIPAQGCAPTLLVELHLVP